MFQNLWFYDSKMIPILGLQSKDNPQSILLHCAGICAESD